MNEETQQDNYNEWLNSIRQEEATWFNQPEDFSSSNHYE